MEMHTKRKIEVSTLMILCTFLFVLMVGGIGVNAAESGNYLYEVINKSTKTCRFLGYKASIYDDDWNEVVYTPKPSADGTYTISIPSTINGYTVTEVGKLQNVYDISNDVTKVIIPSTVQKVASGILSDFYNLDKVEVNGGGMTTLTSDLFYNFQGKLAEFVVPDSVKVVDSNAFNDINIEVIKFNKTSQLQQIKDKAFYYSGVQQVIFSDGCPLTTIGDSAFEEAYNLQAINLDKCTKLTSVGNKAFYNCTNLDTDLSKCVALVKIGDNAFYSTHLSKITIPATVRQIGTYAFSSIYNQDEWGTSEPVIVTFATRTEPLLLGNYVFYDTYIDTLSLPNVVINNGVQLRADYIFDTANTFVTTNPTLKINGFSNVNVNTVKAPYGSQIWAMLYNTKQGYNAESISSFVQLKSDILSDDYWYNNGGVSFTSVKLTSATTKAVNTINVTLDSTVSKTSKTAQNVVATVYLGGATFKLETISQIKQYFTVSDVQKNGVGTLTISNKSGSKLQLSSKIIKTYTIQASDISKAVIDFDTEKDSKSGIYSKEYGTYIWKGNSTAIKPTVKVTLNGEVINAKYYIISYKNNVGLCKNPTVTITLNEAGVKLYQGNSISKTFKIKRSISSCDIFAKGVIEQGKMAIVENQEVKMTSNAAKSGFLPITSEDSTYKISYSNFIVKATFNGTAGTKMATNRYAVEYDDWALASFDIGNYPLGEVTATVKAKENDDYLYGEATIRYNTKYNISRFSASDWSLSFDEYGDGVQVKKTNDINKKAMFYAGEQEWTGVAQKPIASVSFGGIYGEAYNSIGGTLTYAYKNNKDVSKSGAITDLAKVNVKVANCAFLYGTRDIYYKIVARSITPEMFSVKGYSHDEIPEFDYSGSAIKPELATATGITANDYTVSYSNNTKVGIATIKITGKNNLKGSTELKFSIKHISISKCTITIPISTKNEVSTRFGLSVEPNISVAYNGKEVSNSEYKVTYIGTKNSNDSYTGTGVTKAGEVGYYVVSPSEKSTIFVSTNEDMNLLTYYYGEDSVTGVLKSYKLKALTLEQLDIGFEEQPEVRSDLNTTISTMKPYIMVNGQKMTFKTVEEVRSELNTKLKAYYGSKKTTVEINNLVDTKMPLYINNKKVRFIYGWHTNINSEPSYYTIVRVVNSKLVWGTAKSGVKPVDIIDDYYVKFDGGYFAPFSLSYTLKTKDYVRVYDNTRATYNLVIPGQYDMSIINAHTLDKGITGDDVKTFNFTMAPKGTSLKNDFDISSLIPGNIEFKFTASTTDMFDGKTEYIIKLYKTEADYNAHKPSNTFEMRYAQGNSAITNKALTLGKSDTNYIYTYKANSLDYGAYYLATITTNVLDEDEMIRGKESTLIHFQTSTYQASVDSVTVKNKGNSQYSLTMNIKEPVYRLESTKSTSVTGIKYIVQIYTLANNKYTLVKSYTVYPNSLGVSDNMKLDSKGNVIIDIGGLKSNLEYTAKIVTKQYFKIGNYTEKETETVCNYVWLGGNQFVTNANDKFNFTSEALSVKHLVGKFTVDKTKVNSRAPISFITNMKSGVANYNYTYKLQYKATKDGTYTDYKTYTQNGKSADFTFKLDSSIDTLKAGYYKVLLTVTDKNGKTFTANTEFEVVTQLQNTSTLSTTSISKSSTVTVNLSSKYGYGVKQYEVWCYKPNSSSAIKLREATTGTSYIIPADINDTYGEYKVVIKVIDETGYLVRKGLKYKVVNTLKNNSVINNISYNVGETATFSIAVTGAKGTISYQLMARSKTGDKWNGWATVVAWTTDKTKIKYTIKNVGEYKFKMQIKDSANGATDEALYHITTKLAELENNSTIKGATAIVGNKGVFEITKSATGGKPDYTYTISYAPLTSSTFTTITGTKTPELSVGDYTIRIVVKDKNGTTAVREYVVSIISPDSMISSFKLVSGEKVLSSTSTVTSGTPIHYRSTTERESVTLSYYYKKTTDKSWTQAKFVDGDYVAIPAKAGVEYQFKVVATDEIGVQSESIITLKSK